jgi:hypothetical protein
LLSSKIVSSRYTYASSRNRDVAAGDCYRRPDLLISTDTSGSETHDWRRIRVVGELKENPKVSNHAPTIVKLASFAREIFYSQPSRRFVHGFTLCGDLLRAWVFDRAGAMGSVHIAINAEPILFLRVVCRYAAMNASEVGFDPTIFWRHPVDESESVFDPTVAIQLETISRSVPAPYIHINQGRVNNGVRKPDVVGCSSQLYNIDGETNGRPLQGILYIDRHPIFRRRAIVSRASVIWRASRTPLIEGSPALHSDLCIKDQWRDAKRGAEGDLLRQMVDIPGITRYVYHEDLCSIAEDIRVHLHGPTSTTTIPTAGRHEHPKKKPKTTPNPQVCLNFCHQS